MLKNIDKKPLKSKLTLFIQWIINNKCKTVSWIGNLSWSFFFFGVFRITIVGAALLCVYLLCLQNDSETWYTESPKLSPCFQSTVLVWTPCLFLWVFAPLETYYILHSKTRNIQWNWLNVSKLVSGRVLFCLIVPPMRYGITLNKDLTVLQNIWFTGSLWIL